MHYHHYRTDFRVRWAILLPVSILLFICLGLAIAFGRDNGQWSGISPERREWFNWLAQPDSQPGYPVSCCGDADAYESDLFETTAAGDIIAIVTDGTGNEAGKPTLPDGTRITVPAKKIVTGEMAKNNPTGHGWIFLHVDEEGGQRVYCYIMPAGL